MKHMKLGSKQDIFKTQENVVTVVNDLPSDLVIEAGGILYHLHKYPLLSKSGYLRNLVSEINVANADTVIHIKDIPGTTEAFVLCAKFCYGIAVTLNAFNVIAVRCAAQYLEMTEEMEKGNLIFMIDYFLNSCIFRAWKDCIISLQSTKLLLPWAEDLKLVATCIDSIASMASVDQAKVTWSFTYTRVTNPSTLWPGIISTNQNATPLDSNAAHQNMDEKKMAPSDWWVEDICQLDIDLYHRVVSAIKSKGRIGSGVIWKALMAYAYKCLPTIKDQKMNLVPVDASYADDYVDIEMVSKHRHSLEIIVSLLPSEKGSYSCTFMLKLLKAASLLEAALPLKKDLARRIGMQLDDASLNDILIPSFSYANESVYDVDMIQSILEHFMARETRPEVAPPCTKTGLIGEGGVIHETQSSTSSIISSSMLRVSKLVDAYLAEIAKDPNLTLSKFIGLAELVPGFARQVHDGLYRAIDVYLKEHKELTKAEKKRICRLLDCKKLSMDVCMHVAQNEHLPLRIIVQVLFFEQMRSMMTADDVSTKNKSLLPLTLPNEKTLSSLMLEEEWDAHVQGGTNTPRDSVKVVVEKAECQDTKTLFGQIKSNSSRGRGIFASAIFSKIWLSLTKLLG